MDESTYNEDDGNTTDDDHPISWCHRYDGGRAWYTGMGHTQASYSEPGFQTHLETGIEVAAGVLPDKDCGVTDDNPGGEHTDVEVPVGGVVPNVLALTIGTPPSLGTFIPGQAKDYTSSVSATVTSSAAAATLSVRDANATATGHLVNGDSALPQVLQVNATDAAHPTGAFAPLSTSGAALSLLSYTGPVGADAVTIGFKQPIAATDSLLRGSYSKTLTFTLASSGAASQLAGRRPAGASRPTSRADPRRRRAAPRRDWARR
jgi:hypothetical protein